MALDAMTLTVTVMELGLEFLPFNIRDREGGGGDPNGEEKL